MLIWMEDVAKLLISLDNCIKDTNNCLPTMNGVSGLILSTLKNRNLLNFEQVTHYPLFSIAGIEYGSFINKKEVFFAFTMEDVRQLEEVSSSSGPQMLAFDHMCPKVTQSKSHEQRTRSVLTFMTRREGNKSHYLETTG